MHELAISLSCLICLLLGIGLGVICTIVSIVYYTNEDEKEENNNENKTS